MSVSGTLLGRIRVRNAFHILAFTFFCASFLTILGHRAFAQEQPNPQSDTIRGTVVNQLTGEPIGRALVYSPDNRFATMTDSEGHFEFTITKPAAKSKNAAPAVFRFGVQPSGDDRPFALMARKPGFLDDPYALRGAPQPGADLRLSLIPEAIIQGRVIANTEPAKRITVQLFKETIQEGLPRWMPASQVVANSQGEYRFAELSPGSYKVITLEQLDTDPETVAQGGQRFGFPPAGFPGVADFASASRIQVNAGQQFQADIPLRRQSYFPVNLPVLTADANQGVNVTVSRQGSPGPGYSLGYNPGTHRVEGLLPNGTYLVELNAFGRPAQSGAAYLTVAGAPVQGPGIALTPAASISVDVREEFTSTERQVSSFYNGVRTFQLRGPRAYLNVWLEPADDFGQHWGGGLRPPSSPSDDSMVIENVQPGRYWVRFSASRGYVAAATSGNVDLLHEPLAVSSGSYPVQVVMRDDTAELDGTVAGATKTAVNGGDGNPNTAAYIYCIPVPDSDGQFREFPASPDGSFAAAAMVPGAYRVLAFARPHQALPYRDAQAMRAYETQGLVVNLTPGQTQRIQLQMISE